MDALRGLIESELRGGSAQEAATYRVYTHEYDVVETPPVDRHFDHRRELASLGRYVSPLVRRLLRTLIGRRERRWLSDKTRGSLDGGRLHRLCTGRSGRIFRQKVVSDGGPTACTLLLDLSSSMSGDQIELCRRLALLFGETLERLSFPTEIIGFSTDDRDLRDDIGRQTGQTHEEISALYTRLVPLRHVVFKTFREPWRAAAGRLGRVECLSLTPLGESLLFAGRRLAAMPEKRKVLLCLTDGQPVVGTPDEIVTFEHARAAVERLARSGIEPVGIGIAEPSVRSIFPRSAVIHTLQDLPGSFLKELSAALTQAGGSHA